MALRKLHAVVIEEAFARARYGNTSAEKIQLIGPMEKAYANEKKHKNAPNKNRNTNEAKFSSVFPVSRPVVAHKSDRKTI